MDNLLKKSIIYLSKILGSKIDYTIKSMPKELPYYFSKNYELVSLKMMGLEFVLLLDDNDFDMQPKHLIKRISLLEKALEEEIPVVYCNKSMDWYMRDRLLKNNISFLVPDLQMYMPFIGVAFMEKHQKVKKVRGSLSPSTQFFFFELINRSDRLFKMSDFDNLGLSNMSINRALNELYEIDILNKVKRGNSIEWSLNETGESLWQSMQDYLFNPIQKLDYVMPQTYDFDERTELILAGESELSEISMLGSPTRKIYAIGNREWIKIKSEFEVTSQFDEECIIVEVWKHKVPTLKGRIHPLALMLTVRDVMDERVQISLEEVYEEYDWEENNG